jgi:5-methylthioadenosine/S-adenosylhomocysteine deaminase
VSLEGASRSSGPARADVVIANAVVVTMNDAREILADGAVAIAGDRIVDVGPTADVDARTVGTERIDASHHVVVPGLVNAHIHVTGEPLTRGFVPDDVPFEENVFGWLSPLGACATENDERLAAQLAATEMLRTGTTAFLEAGTGWYLDAVAEALVDVGIRARVGRRIWDLPEKPAKFRQTTDAAIANLAAGLERHRSHADGRVKATTILVGHATCSDDLWRAARQLADEYGTGLSFHMSPAPCDPEDFLARTGRRPFEHLDRLGVLAADTTAVHCVHVDESEIEILAARGCNVVHCPTTALKVAYGVTALGKFPEMLTAGVHLCLGTDGNNASNYSDLMRATYLAAGLFKDARRDPTLVPAEQALELATLGGARALLADDEIGSIEVGNRADLVLHDRDRPEWTPLHNVVSQLVWSADGRSVDTVFVDGRKVVDHGHLTTLDEERLFAEAQRAGSDLVARSGLPDRTRWPIVGQLADGGRRQRLEHEDA